MDHNNEVNHNAFLNLPQQRTEMNDSVATASIFYSELYSYVI